MGGVLVCLVEASFFGLLMLVYMWYVVCGGGALVGMNKIDYVMLFHVLEFVVLFRAPVFYLFAASNLSDVLNLSGVC
jgi:hypothetical protein